MLEALMFGHDEIKELVEFQEEIIKEIGEEKMEYEHLEIEEELKKLPAKPGVYLMHDSHDTIIYVGKAKNLYNRVNSYFVGKQNNKTTKQKFTINTLQHDRLWNKRHN